MKRLLTLTSLISMAMAGQIVQASTQEMWVQCSYASSYSGAGFHDTFLLEEEKPQGLTIGEIPPQRDNMGGIISGTAKTLEAFTLVRTGDKVDLIIKLAKPSGVRSDDLVWKDIFEKHNKFQAEIQIPGYEDKYASKISCTHKNASDF